MLNEFGAAISSLRLRVKPHLPQISGTLKSGLNNRSANVKQQTADLISVIAVVMKQCKKEQLMGHLEVFCMGTLINCYQIRVSLILKNRHEKVKKNCIELVGCITTRGAEYVPEREWMLICDRLHEMLICSVSRSGKITGKYPTCFGLVLRMLLWLDYPVFV
nr:hypothetical protein [Tanacetum cinerariifolium]